MTTQAQPSQTMGVPLARRHITRGPDAVAWRSRCPHGGDGEWRAERHDTRVDVTVECCPPTVVRANPYGVVIPLPEETA